MRILICDGLHECGLDLLRSTEGIEVDAPDQWSMDQIREHLPDYDGMVVRSRTRVTEEMLNHAKNLKVIGRAGTGVDNIDIQAASTRGILVMNTPGANAMAAAEHAMALMLSLARHIPQANQSIHEGKWEKKRFMGTELYEQVLGIIGLGRIGSIVAERALGMGMKVIGYDPFMTSEAASAIGVELVDLDDLFAKSSFITLHTPQTKETQHIINSVNIEKMQPGTRIINCARGGLIDEQALYEALIKGHIAGAALDVFSSEPPTDNPLVSLDNVIATPHLGASSVQAQANVARTIASQLKDYLTDNVIRNAVNFPSISSIAYDKLQPYLILAEKLGTLQGQLHTSIERLEIEYSGPEMEELPLEPITQTIAKSFLEPILSENVNLVNALIMLQNRQIKLVTATTSEHRGYSGMITVKTFGTEQGFSTSGTVFPGEGARLIGLNNYQLEAKLEGINLIIQNLDKPGVVGLLGTTIGNFKVNIANMHLSRTPDRDKAMSIIQIDEPITDKAIETLSEHPNIISVHQVKL